MIEHLACYSTPLFPLICFKFNEWSAIDGFGFFEFFRPINFKVQTFCYSPKIYFFNVGRRLPISILGWSYRTIDIHAHGFGLYFLKGDLSFQVNAYISFKFGLDLSHLPPWFEQLNFRNYLTSALFNFLECLFRFKFRLTFLMLFSARLGG